MRTKFIALLVICMVLCSAKDVLAYKVYHYSEDGNIRAEAALRNIMLIPVARAQAIAAGRLGTVQVIFPNIELYNAGSTSADFRPAYKLECVSSNNNYVIVVDAARARVLSFEEQD